MTRALAFRMTATSIVMVVLGWAAVRYAPDHLTAGYMWPSGLAAGLMVLSPSWLRLWSAGAVAVMAISSLLLAGLPAWVAIGFGLSYALGAVVAQQVYAPGSVKRLLAGETYDLIPYGIAIFSSAVVIASGVGLTSLVLDRGVVWENALAAGTAALATNALLFAPFRAPVEHRGIASLAERITIGAVVIYMGHIAYQPDRGASIAFITLPLLGWAAFRLSTRDSLIILLIVSALAIETVHHGHGPFFNDVALGWLPDAFVLLPVQTYVFAAASLVIPFATAVGMQRRSNAEAIMERTRSLRLIEAARGIAIIGTDPLGRINLFNPGAELILGYRPDEVFGQSMRMFFSQAEIARQAHDLGTDPTYMSVLPAMLDLPPGTSRDWQFTRKDGLERTLSTILSPVTDDLGTFTGYVVTADDVTEQLRTQVALEKALETERRAVSRLVEVDQVKDAFVSAVSHELRTPITNIVGYLELLVDEAYGDINDKQGQALGRIDLNSRRLLTLIDDLLTLSSVENIDGLQTHDPVDLVTIVTRAVEIIRPTLLHRELDLVVDLPDEPHIVIGDEGQLERLVINLATNAVKFTPDSGRVTIRLLGTERLVVVEVIDTGMGIPEEEQHLLFSRFFRTTQAREGAVQGSGLGLSITKSIAERHGGRIFATSAHGEGSTFRVELPRSS